MLKYLSKLRIKLLMKDQFRSATLRRIFLERHDIAVGLYSYGCFDTNRIPKGSVIGRYCSFSPTCTILNGNHGLQCITTHPYLYNVTLGMVEKETITRTICHVSDDVWIGHNAIILPSVSSIGRGAVVAAGAVVTKNVPAYSIVAGNPAKIIKYRFDDKTIEKIEETKWWEKDYERFAAMIKNDLVLVYTPLLYFNSFNEPSDSAPR